MKFLIIFSFVGLLLVVKTSVGQVCIVVANCSDHTTSDTDITYDSATQSCICKCRNEWSGSNCSYCGPIYNASRDCAACSVGRGFFPNCTLGCNNDQDCNGRSQGDPLGNRSIP